MLTQAKSIFLADDDADDCFLFEDALKAIEIPTHLTTAQDGVELMKLLHPAADNLPYALFLDLNMPRKNGLQCLAEIKRHEKLKFLDVIILSTSFQHDVANQLFSLGAKYCVRKPPDFNLFKALIRRILTEKEPHFDIPASEIEETEKFMFSS